MADYSDGNPPVTDGFPSQKDSYAENVSVDDDVIMERE